jgi:hypothetical protein
MIIRILVAFLLYVIATPVSGQALETDSSFQNTSDLEVPNKLSLRTTKGESIRIVYLEPEIKIFFSDKRPPILIPYSAPDSVTLPCTCLAVKLKSGNVVFKDHFILRDSLLVLPMFYHNANLELMVINLNKGVALNFVRKKYTSHYLDGRWLILNESSSEMVSISGFPLDNYKLVRFYQLKTGLFKLVKAKKLKVEYFDLEQEKGIKAFIKTLKF